MMSLWLAAAAAPPPPYAPNSAFCDNTCYYYFANGVCQDGGPGSEEVYCDFGTDCDDCGVRLMPPAAPPAPPPLPPSLPPPPALPGRCDNTCTSDDGSFQQPAGYYSDGRCSDGGPGSEYESWLRVCDLGTDCDDCGVRVYPPSPPSAPPQSPGMCDNTCIKCDFLGCSGLASQTQADMAVYTSNGVCNDGGEGKRPRDSNPRASTLPIWKVYSASHVRISS